MAKRPTAIQPTNQPNHGLRDDDGVSKEAIIRRAWSSHSIATLTASNNQCGMCEVNQMDRWQWPAFESDFSPRQHHSNHEMQLMVWISLASAKIELMRISLELIAFSSHWGFFF